MNYDSLSYFSLESLYQEYNNLNRARNPSAAKALRAEIIKREVESGKKPKDVFFLADRGDRLIAAIIDAVILVFPVLIYSLIFGFIKLNSGETGYSISEQIFNLLTIQAIFLAFHGYLLFTKGQTIGKKFMEIKIIGPDNKHPGFTRVYLLRNFFPAVINIFPLVGYPFLFIDILFIFRKDRKCLHDHIAQTKVIIVDKN